MQSSTEPAAGVELSAKELLRRSAHRLEYLVSGRFAHADDDPTNNTTGERWMSMMEIARGAGPVETNQAIKEYEEKDFFPKKAFSSASFSCQSPLYNKQSVMDKQTLGEVQIRAVPNDGKAECWNKEDEKERSSIWVSVYIPGILFILS